VQTLYSISSKVRERVRNSRILKMEDVNHQGPILFFRDLNKMSRLVNSRRITDQAKLNHHREKNHVSILKKRRFHYQAANNNNSSNRTQVEYGDILGWEVNRLTTPLSRISKRSLFLAARWYQMNQCRRGVPHHSYKDRK
jgi:hypothetical protein